MDFVINKVTINNKTCFTLVIFHNIFSLKWTFSLVLPLQVSGFPKYRGNLTGHSAQVSSLPPTQHLLGPEDNNESL